MGEPGLRSPPAPKENKKIKMLVHLHFRRWFYTLRASLPYLVCSAGEPHNVLAYRTDGSLALSPLSSYNNYNNTLCCNMGAEANQRGGGVYGHNISALARLRTAASDKPKVIRIKEGLNSPLKNPSPVKNKWKDISF